MHTKQIFKPALLSLAVAAAMTSGHVVAQEAETAKNDDSMVEVIAVTGIRGSLMRAQAVKQESTSIVEAISAEDIGKLPDSSIAESLARLPGLAGERVGGRTSGISVRGFKEDFVGTSLNGRELIGIGDNRGIEYDLYPSEIMTGATIHKTSNATLITQGLGGTVDLQTVRPLAASETLTVTGVFERSSAPTDNPDFDDAGHRYSLSFVEKFADDTIGLAVAIASTESPNNQRKYGVWGYNEVQRDTGQVDVDGNAVLEGTGQFAPSGLDTNAQSTLLKRDTISAVLQYQPNDSLNIIADYLQIDFEDSGVLRGVIEPFALLEGSISGEGYNTTGTQTEVNPVLRTDPLNKDGDLKAYGLNFEYYVTDDWKVEVDLSRSEANKFEQRAESYAGLGRSGSLTNADFGTRQFQMSSEGVFFTGLGGLDAFSNPDTLQLTGPQVWGGGLANLSEQFETPILKANGEPFSFLNGQDGFNNFFSIKEELTQFKFEVEGTIEDSIVTKVTAGLHYSDRYKDKENNGFFATANVFPGSQSVTESGVPIAGLTDLTWAGLGYVVAYDGNAPYDNNYYTQNNGSFLEPDRFGDSYVVEEEVTTIYAKADFEYEVGDIMLFGNVGAQYVDTDQTSDGTLGVIGSNFRVCDADSNSVIDDSCAITDGASYSHFLPSISINAEVADNQFVRFGASKTISRARLDQMKASGFVKFDLNDQFITIPNTRADVEEFGTPWSKSAGNAKLRPLESNNFDLSFESYFDEEGYVAVSLFYKDLVNLTRESNPLIDFTNDETNNGADYFVPGFHDRTLDVDFTNSATGEFFPAGSFVTPPDFGYFSFFEDGLKGSVQGAELTANLPLGMFADELEGFGVVASATFIDAEVDDGSFIPGQSDEIYSLVTYYENEGFEVRFAMTDRSGFTTYERAGSNKIGEATRDGTQVVDAQISYDFENSNIESLKGLRISLQGTNLLDDADQVSRNGDGVVTTRREFGPSYMLNVNYSFY